MSDRLQEAMTPWRAFWHGFRLALGIARPRQWTIGATSLSTFHVYPLDDLVDHHANECVCGPTVEPAPNDDGSMHWLVIHHSLDGREASE